MEQSNARLKGLEVFEKSIQKYSTLTDTYCKGIQFGMALGTIAYMLNIGIIDYDEYDILQQKLDTILNK